MSEQGAIDSDFDDGLGQHLSADPRIATADGADGGARAVSVVTGTSSSQKDRIRSVKAIINGLEDETEDGAPFHEIQKEAVVLMDEDDFTDTLQKLKDQREIYEPKNNHYRTT